MRAYERVVCKSMRVCEWQVCCERRSTAIIIIACTSIAMLVVWCEREHDRAY